MIRNNQKVSILTVLLAASIPFATGFAGTNPEPSAYTARESDAFIQKAQTMTRKIQTEKILAEEAARAREAAEREARERAETQAREAVAQEAAAREAAAQEAAAREAAAQEAAALEAASYGASTDEQTLLASIIFCEAGNQSYEGQVAVGAVVMNRIRSQEFPGTISEVIYQSGQFTPAMTGWLDQVLSSGGYTETAMAAAVDALAGANPIGDCLYFDQGGSGMQLGDHYFH